MCHVPSVVNDRGYDLKFTLLWMAAQNEGVTKEITSFYWDDSETVFLGLLTIYIPILYLPTFSESNALDFYLVMTEIPGGGGTLIYGLYKYVPRNRVWFLRFSVLKKCILFDLFVSILIVLSNTGVWKRPPVMIAYY